MKIRSGNFKVGGGEEDDGWVDVTSGAPPRPSYVSVGASKLVKSGQGSTSYRQNPGGVTWQTKFDSEYLKAPARQLYEIQFSIKHFQSWRFAVDPSLLGCYILSTGK